jgi:hypothetical protein
MNGRERSVERKRSEPSFPGKEYKNMLHLAKALAGFGIYPKKQFWNCENTNTDFPSFSSYLSPPTHQIRPPCWKLAVYAARHRVSLPIFCSCMRTMARLKRQRRRRQQHRQSKTSMGACSAYRFKVSNVPLLLVRSHNHECVAKASEGKVPE